MKQTKKVGRDKFIPENESAEMKQVFKLYIDGVFAQYLGKSELHLLTREWVNNKRFTLEMVTITKQDYKIIFGK